MLLMTSISSLGLDRAVFSVILNKWPQLQISWSDFTCIHNIILYKKTYPTTGNLGFCPFRKFKFRSVTLVAYVPSGTVGLVTDCKSMAMFSKIPWSDFTCTHDIGPDTKLFPTTGNLGLYLLGSSILLWHFGGNILDLNKEGPKGHSKVSDHWKQMGDTEKKVALQSEMSRMKELPGNSSYATHRIRVLSKDLNSSIPYPSK
eukprot:Gb_14351 [translate_table: standard]